VNERAFGTSAEADLVDTLRARQKVVLSLVAVLDGRVVGHILFSPAAIESGGELFPVVALAPMAVLPEYQRKGVGSLLVSTSRIGDVAALVAFRSCSNARGESASAFRLRRTAEPTIFRRILNATALQCPSARRSI
jgi:GNAT superfamily N-acetyltransferase